MNDLATRLRANGLTQLLEPLEGYNHCFSLTTAGETAIPLWRKLRTLVDRTGYWPVVLGDKNDALDGLSDARETDPASAQETLARAQTIDPAAWIRTRREDDPDLFDHIEEGPWTPDAASPMTTFALPYDSLNKRPHPAVLVALVPTRVSAEVPAYLRLGNWNDCPEPAVHVAFATRWQQRYAAEIVCAGRDILEMTVVHPPATREEALILAREQYMYCSDIVDQGVATISNLAATLLNAPQWYFWWD